MDKCLYAYALAISKLICFSKWGTKLKNKQNPTVHSANGEIKKIQIAHSGAKFITRGIIK